MTVIFQAPAGATAPVYTNSGRAVSSLFSLPGKPKDVIVTGIQHDQKVAAQFRQSLRRVLYVFPFGDEPSQTNITFTLFGFDCDGNPTTAVEDMLNYYDQIKLKPSAADPIDIVIGGKAIKALVMGLNLGLSQAGLQPIFTATMNVIGWDVSS